jgi:hypothetical protein
LCALNAVVQLLQLGLTMQNGLPCGSNKV